MNASPAWTLGYAATRLGQLHWRRCGAGQPAVLLPAASQSHNHLTELGSLLVRTHDVAIFDMPGSGYSAPLPARVEFADVAAAVAEAIGSLFDAPVLLYGIHTGNKIAASLAVQRPDLVRGLVLCGQSHSLVVDKAARAAQMRQVSAHRFSSPSGTPEFRRLREQIQLWREIDAMWFAPEMPSGADDQQEFVRRRHSVADLLLALDSLPALYEANFRYDLAADLARIAAPTLVVEIATPREDGAIGRQAGAVTSLMPRAQSVTFCEPDGLGLTLEARAAELYAAICEFERTLPPTMPKPSRDTSR
jgi:pimeloyl-ACP methyl ester carboxylesterase